MKATIYFWACGNFESQTGYKHNQEIPAWDVFRISQEIFMKGLNTMLSHEGEDIVLFVDDKRFTQR